MRPAGASTRLRWLLVAIAIGCFALYANTIANPYSLDDTYRISNNPEIRYVGNPLRHFLDPTTSSTLPTIVQYRPLLPLSLSLGRALLEPLGIPSLAADHLGNIAFHAGICLLLFAWTQHLFRMAWGREGPSRERAEEAALWVAALYAVHPVAGVPVNYLCARDLLLMQLLVLAALYCWARYRGEGEGEGGERRWLAGALGCFALSLCAKQNGAVLPLLLVLYELLIQRRRLSQIESWTGAAFFALVVGAFVAWTHGYVEFSDLDQLEFKRDPQEYPATMAQVHWSYYLRNAIWPFAMRPLADIEATPNFASAGSLIGAAGILATMGLAWRWRRRRPLLAFAIAGYWVMFSVTGSIRPFRFIVTDYRQVPSLPYLIILGVAAAHSIRGLDLRRQLLGVVLAYFAISSFALNRTWRSGEALWGNAVRLGTRAIGEVNYALALKPTNPKKARVHLLHSLEESERNVYALINLGLVELDLGMREQGVITLEHATEVAPNYGIAHYWHARGLAIAERTDEVADAAVRAAQLEPNNTRYMAYAIQTLTQAGRLDEAEALSATATREDAELRRAREQLAAQRQLQN